MKNIITFNNMKINDYRITTILQKFTDKWGKEEAVSKLQKAAQLEVTGILSDKDIEAINVFTGNGLSNHYAHLFEFHVN